MRRVALIGENSIEYVNVLLNIWNAGYSAVLIDWRIPQNLANEIMKNAQVKICYIEKELSMDFISIKEKGYDIITYERKKSLVSCLSKDLFGKFHAKYSQDEALILFSSGTTGKSKGIILSHYAINKNADAIISYMMINERDSMLIVKPFHHVSTIVGELLVCLKSKINTYICSSLIMPQVALETLFTNQITTICLNPTLLYLYTKCQKNKSYEMSKLKAIYVSGSMVDKKLLIMADSAFSYASILNVYGLSEAGPRLTAQTLAQNNVIGSVGKPIENVAIKIVKSSGQKAEAGEIGAIYAKTLSAFSGYVQNSDNVQIIQDGWINTKDMGYLDKENNLFIVGRGDNMIHIGSHNVFPESVENIIRSMDFIDDCAVVGSKNLLYGNILICYYVADRDMEGDIKAYCGNKLIAHEIPRKYVRLNGIPRTPNGKLNYNEIKSWEN